MCLEWLVAGNCSLIESIHRAEGDVDRVACRVAVSGRSRMMSSAHMFALGKLLQRGRSRLLQAET